MEFTASTKDFLRELTLARDGAQKKTTIPILSNVLLEATGDHVTLTATDLELSLRCTFPANVQQEGSSTIPAHKLHAYLRLLNSEDVHVKVKQDTHWAAFVSGRNRTRIAGMSRENFPDLPERPDSLAQIPSKALLSLVGRVAFAITTEESRFTLQGALLLLDKHSMTLVATDGHRLAFARAEKEIAVTEPVRVILPARAMRELGKLAIDADGAQISFATDESHLFFRVGERLLTVRKLTGQFPDYERVLPQDGAEIANVDRAELQAAIARVAEFADERSHAMRVDFRSGELKISASSIDHGESEETVSCAYAGPEMEIGFNAEYVMEFLSVSEGERVMLRVKDKGSAGEMRPAVMVQGEQYRYVIMPMRI